MVIAIDEFPQEMHRPAAQFVNVAAPPEEIGLEANDDGPNDDPPMALRLAA